MAWDDDKADISKIRESIFAKSELWPYNAFVEANWDLYATGYKNAADHLVDRAASAHQQDFIVYPAMFLYRHYLELRLKEVLLAEYAAEMRQYEADMRAEYEADMRAEYQAEMHQYAAEMWAEYEADMRSEFQGEY